MNLEDESGPINGVISPGIYQRDRTIFKLEPIVCVEGRLQRQGRVVSMKAERFVPVVDKDRTLN